MKQLRYLVVLWLSTLSVLACGAKRTTDTPGGGGGNNVGIETLDDGASLTAESFREFLALRGLISPGRGDMSDVFNWYLDRASCPFTHALAGPPVASESELNTFVVGFDQAVGDACAGEGQLASACRSLHGNCLTLQSSVFCDADYLRQRQAVSAEALATLFSALRGVTHRGEPWTVPPQTTLALRGLAEVTSFYRSGRTATLDLRPAETPIGTGFATLAPQLWFATSNVGVHLALSHEFAHVEQGYCSVAADPVVEALTTDYSTLTCGSHLSHSEITADIRGLTLTQQAIQEYGDQIKRNAGSIPGDLTGDVRLTVVQLTRIAPLLLSLAVIYNLEFDVIVQPDPDRALQWLPTQPPESLRALTESLLAAGSATFRGQPPSHIEPGARSALLASQIDFAAIVKASNNPDFAATIRIAPYVLGRVMAMQTECGQGTMERAGQLGPWIFDVFHYRGGTAGGGAHN